MLSVIHPNGHLAELITGEIFKRCLVWVRPLACLCCAYSYHCINAFGLTFTSSVFTFQTDGSVPNTFVIANVEVVKPRVAAAEHISQVALSLHNKNCISKIFWLMIMRHSRPIMFLLAWFFLFLQFNEEARSPFVRKYKTIIHPGEVCLLPCWWGFIHVYTSI